MGAPATRLEAHREHVARRVRMRSYEVVARPAPPEPERPAEIPATAAPRRPAVSTIVGRVAAHYGCAPDELRGSFSASMVDWRAVAVALALRCTYASTDYVAEYFGTQRRKVVRIAARVRDDGALAVEAERVEAAVLNV